MKRILYLALAAVGVAGFLAAGPISARVPGVVHSTNNSAQTGKFTPPHRVEAAAVEEGVSCSDPSVQYGKAPTAIPAVMEALPNIDSSGAAFSSKRMCIRNVGRATGQVRFAALNIAETEVTCEAEEVDPALGNDTTCTTNADGTVSGAGELAPILDVTVGPDGTNPTGCGNLQLFPFSSVRPTANNVVQWRTLASTLAPGETCRYRWNGQLSGSTTEQQRFLAQTDRVGWVFQFNLEDIPA